MRPLEFVSGTLCSVALVSEQLLYENYAILYSHTNTVISHARNLWKIENKEPEKLKHSYVGPLKFVSGTLCSVALVSEQPLYENYATLYSHTNTVISHALSYMSRP